MSNFDFPCRFEKLEDGTEIVRCRDLPELLSYSVDGEPLENWARYAVEDCVEFRIKDGEIIPEASPALPGEYVVHLDANQVAKILLSNEMVRDGVSRAELAKKAELKLPEVTRILDIHHPTKIDRIETILRSLGHRLQLSIA
jgi:antitoxin HicB